MTGRRSRELIIPGSSESDLMLCEEGVLVLQEDELLSKGVSADLLQRPLSRVAGAIANVFSKRKKRYNPYKPRCPSIVWVHVVCVS